jgi:hypothetical protein
MRDVSKVAATMALLASAAAYGGSESGFAQAVPAEPKGAVEISNVSGNVEVVGWDRPEVSVRADLGEAERVDVSSDHGHTRVKVVLPHPGHGGGADLHVKVPKESEVTVSAVSADVVSSGVLGQQRLHTVSGDITAELAGSDVEVKTVSGDVKLKGHGQPARLHVGAVSGDVRLEHGAGELEAGTVNGTLVVSLDSARSVRLHTTSGDLHFEGTLTRGADFDATAISGDLNVRASADGGYNYDVSSFSGEISNCFGVEPNERPHGHGPEHKLQGTRGEGAGRMHLKTMSGDIQVCDRK